MATRLPPEDEALIEQFRQHYAPPPLTTARRVMMRHTLAARLRRPAIPVPTWLLTAAVAGAGVLAVWLTVPERTPSPPAAVAISGDVLAAYAFEGDGSDEIDDLLPPDYSAIDSMLEI